MRLGFVGDGDAPWGSPLLFVVAESGFWFAGAFGFVASEVGWCEVAVGFGEVWVGVEWQDVVDGEAFGVCVFCFIVDWLSAQVAVWMVFVAEFRSEFAKRLAGSASHNGSMMTVTAHGSALFPRRYSVYFTWSSESSSRSFALTSPSRIALQVGCKLSASALRLAVRWVT